MFTFASVRRIVTQNPLPCTVQVSHVTTLPAAFRVMSAISSFPFFFFKTEILQAANGRDCGHRCGRVCCCCCSDDSAHSASPKPSVSVCCRRFCLFFFFIENHFVTPSMCCHLSSEFFFVGATCGRKNLFLKNLGKTPRE